HAPGRRRGRKGLRPTGDWSWPRRSRARSMRSPDMTKKNDVWRACAMPCAKRRPWSWASSCSTLAAAPWVPKASVRRSGTLSTTRFRSG
ncbi:hypothetical protein LTR94_036509, partial [Friedmanniomyces endolithicus]